MAEAVFKYRQLVMLMGSHGVHLYSKEITVDLKRVIFCDFSTETMVTEISHIKFITHKMYRH